VPGLAEQRAPKYSSTASRHRGKKANARSSNHEAASHQTRVDELTAGADTGVEVDVNMGEADGSIFQAGEGLRDQAFVDLDFWSPHAGRGSYSASVLASR
jgi:hypothetical protein